MSKKLFGTDGVRGIANTYPLTIEFCTKLAIVLSDTVCLKQHRVAIARDTRISGQMLFSALCAGFTAKGIDVIDLGIIPTPLCTTLTPNLDVDMSIMITASHNPYQDNGLKLIDCHGDKFSDSKTNALEEKLEKDIEINCNPEKIGKITTYGDALSHYLDIADKIVGSAGLKGMRIALDSANGSFSGILGPVFQSLGADVISLAETPNGFNINAECGSQHTEKLSETVCKQKCDLGIAVDGDGDRIIICDENGKRLDGDQIIAYLAACLQKNKTLKGNTVVATVYSNLGLGKYIRSLQLDFQASAVGERYVIDKMREFGANLGGEESGHMVLSDYSKTGDALIAALVVARGICTDKRKVSEIFPVFEPFPCASHNLKFADKNTVERILDEPSVKSCIADIDAELEGHGRILVRKSGTEPVIRLKIEDENAQLAQKQAEKLLACINAVS